MSGVVLLLPLRVPFAADFRALNARNYKRTFLSSALGYRKDHYLLGSETGCCVLLIGALLTLNPANVESIVSS